MPSWYELSDLEIEILLWAVGKATYMGGWQAPFFTAKELQALIQQLKRDDVEGNG